jgi:DNA invertase Pin-like site-specific DNA recombinase
MLQLNTPKPYDVLHDMKEKGIKVTTLIAETKLSSQTVYRFLNEEGSSFKTIQTITDYVNNYKDEK